MPLRWTRTGPAPPDIHAAQHATGGTDHVTPAAIGAALEAHAAQHASGGADPVTAAAIGALAAVMTKAAAGDNVLDSKVSGDAQPRFILDADGGLGWSPGTTAADVALFRSGVGILSLLGKFAVSGELEVDGALNHDGATVGFFGVAPVARQTHPGGVGGDVIDGLYGSQEQNVLTTLRDSYNALVARLQAYGLIV